MTHKSTLFTEIKCQDEIHYKETLITCICGWKSEVLVSSSHQDLINNTLSLQLVYLEHYIASIEEKINK